METKTGKTKEKEKRCSRVKLSHVQTTHWSIALSLQWHLLFALHKVCRGQVTLQVGFSEVKKGILPFLPVLFILHLASRAEFAWLRDCLQNQCCQIAETRALVSARAGISLPLKCMWLILGVRGGNNSNASPSGSRNFLGSNIKLASSVKKTIQRKVFASAQSQDLPFQGTQLPHLVIVAQGRQKCPSNVSALQQHWKYFSAGELFFSCERQQWGKFSTAMPWVLITPPQIWQSLHSY